MSWVDLILPCPCCGNDVDYVHIDDPESPNQGGHYLECQNKSCRLTSALHFGEDADQVLITRWNRRTYININQELLEALRLALDLGMRVSLRQADADGGSIRAFGEEEDPYIATRRAIVKAAAEIEKTKGE